MRDVIYECSLVLLCTIGCQSKGSQFESFIFQPEITDLYLHWKSCFSGDRHFSAVCQSGQKSRTRTGVDPEDSSCLKEIDKKVFEYRLHLEKNLNSRDIACPFKVDYRRGKHFIMCLITFLSTGTSLYRGKAMVPYVQLSTNCGLGYSSSN